MKTTLRNLWTNQDGAIVSAEIMLVTTILVLGTIVGLKSVRDSVVSELADVAQALSGVSQSYCYSAVQGHAGYSDGAHFQDLPDFCDTPGGDFGQQSKCVNVAAWARGEK